MTGTQHVDVVATLPVLVTFGTALVVLIADLFWPRGRRWLAVPLSVAGLVAATGLTVWLGIDGPRSTFCTADACSYVEDRFAVVLQLVMLVATVVVVVMGRQDVDDARMPHGEYHFLLLSSAAGGLTMAAGRDLLVLLIALEVVSVPAFVLVGLRRGDPRSSESALKFFLIGVVSSAVTLLGMSWVYGVTGALQLQRVSTGLAHAHGLPLAGVAVVLTLVGFAFKVSAVPFHAWVPDTYEGAPVAVAAYLSVVSKTAGFVGLIVLSYVGFASYASTWRPVLGVLAALTMSVGNLVALRQRQVVRLLAWSSIAQAGYMLAPFAAASQHGARAAETRSATVTYLALYAVMNLGAFACVAAVGRTRPGQRYADYRGLARQRPLVAVALAFFFACLAGLPPGVAGLFAKLAVFRPLVDGRVGWLVVVMAVNTVVALYYYARITFSLFTEPDGEAVSVGVRRAMWPALAAGVAVVGAVILSVYPQWIFSAADLASR